MKIDNIQINNWSHPGEQWWASVQAKADEPLIVATIRMTLSWNEYQQLLAKSSSDSDCFVAWHNAPK